MKDTQREEEEKERFLEEQDEFNDNFADNSDSYGSKYGRRATHDRHRGGSKYSSGNVVAGNAARNSTVYVRKNKGGSSNNVVHEASTPAPGYSTYRPKEGRGGRREEKKKEPEHITTEDLTIKATAHFTFY